MATPTGKTDCGPAAGAILPVSPYLGLFYHFGMLLGVDDLETGQAYHRGKMWLHNAWLHGPGAVWGLGVEIDAGKGAGEIRVRPGLAVDGAGRELHLDGTACLNIAAWVEAHKDDLALREAANAYDDAVDTTPEGSDGALDPLPEVITFDAHVILEFKACLTRPVPAVSTTCAGSETETAFSRVSELVDIFLVPGPPPPRREGYYLLRILFGLAEPRVDTHNVVLPEDALALARREAILALAPSAQPTAYLQAFRELAAMDEIALGPATKDGSVLLFPEGDDTSIVLAKIPAIKLDKGAYVSGGPVDNGVRPVIVPTTTIQELLNGPGLGSLDGDGPRVERAELLPPGDPLPTGIELTVTQALAPGSVALADNPTAFAVTWFDTTWHAVTSPTVTYDAVGAPLKVTLGFDAVPAGWKRIRVRARGTGPTPILSTTFVPLAGATGGAAASADEGVDFVRMFQPSS